MRRPALLAALLATCLSAGLLAPGATAGHAAVATVDLSRDNHGACDMLVPAATTAAQLPTTRTTPGVRLDVLVLVEKADLAVTRTNMTVAARSYAPLGITLAPTYRLVKAVPDPDEDTVAALIWLKKQFPGGRRPAGVDVVYLSTHHYLGAAGQADCIGGVAYPEHAFAVGMTSFDGLVGASIGGVDEPEPALQDGGGKLAAHEIGHLLGAHHHYGAHCVGTTAAEDPTHPCEVMFTVLLAGLGSHFGPLNAAVVRDHAERFAG